MKYQVITGNNIDTLKQYPDNHFDSIITDPPYGIEFLGKDWDSNTGAIETWEQCIRVLKPGGYILAFSAARTYHNLATNIESVGFEIRDQIMWIYGSGFPKAQDMGKAIDKRQGRKTIRPELTRYSGSDEVIPGSFGSGHGKCSYCCIDIVEARKRGQQQACQIEGCEWMEVYKPADNEWAGWKTALKPAHEPIVMARKPFKGSCVDNVIKHGVGALNIDATRIDVADSELDKFQSEWDRESAGHGCLAKLDGTQVDHVGIGKSVAEYKPTGRYPSNVIGEITDEYQKYFYCPKVSRAERHTGFEDPGARHPGADGGGYQVHNVNHSEITQKDALSHIPKNADGMWDAGGQYQTKKDALSHIPTYDRREEGLSSAGIQGIQKLNGEKNTAAGNNHPTVKPVALMRYLITLVTPPGGHVLDPFNGSGSTGMAAVELGYEYTGCELDPAYADIACKRIEAWYHKTDLSGTELSPEWFDETH